MNETYRKYYMKKYRSNSMRIVLEITVYLKMCEGQGMVVMKCLKDKYKIRKGFQDTMRNERQEAVSIAMNPLTY